MEERGLLSRGFKRRSTLWIALALLTNFVAADQQTTAVTNSLGTHSVIASSENGDRSSPDSASLEYANGAESRVESTGNDAVETSVEAKVGIKVTP